MASAGTGSKGLVTGTCLSLAPSRLTRTPFSGGAAGSGGGTEKETAACVSSLVAAMAGNVGGGRSRRATGARSVGALASSWNFSGSRHWPWRRRPGGLSAPTGVASKAFIEAIVDTSMNAFDKFDTGLFGPRTISIPTGDIETHDFDLTKAQKEELYDFGHKAAADFFAKKPTGVTPSAPSPHSQPRGPRSRRWRRKSRGAGRGSARGRR